MGYIQAELKRAMCVLVYSSIEGVIIISTEARATGITTPVIIAFMRGQCSAQGECDRQVSCDQPQ